MALDRSALAKIDRGLFSALGKADLRVRWRTLEEASKPDTRPTEARRKVSRS